MLRLLPGAARNLTTLIGAVIGFIAILLIVLLYLAELLSPVGHPYMGLVTFIVMPVFLIFGLLLMLVGYLRARKRTLSGKPDAPLPSIDLNSPRHRRIVLFGALGGALFLAVSAFGSWQAYQYTDSVKFCGLVCHKVMQPEYTAYQGSPHARVPCVECHIGSGASYFVQSKISGSYQVYSVLFHKYSQPIGTPVHNLRPAKETCEQCHWPRHFYSAKLQSRTYFLSDPQNTRSHVDLLMKIGGDGRPGSPAGIHAHMYLNNTVSYVAMDKGRNNIPYVVSTDAAGKQTIYRTTENPPTQAELDKGEHRTVDCIDCHNRPSHRYNHPAVSVNQAMDRGTISATLPDIKRVAVESLEAAYPSTAAADAGIARSVTDFYAGTYPKVAAGRQADVRQAVAQVQAIYHQNYFPSMKVSWKGYPDHIGHLYSDGCFRCHDGKHVSSDGKVITKSCNACHTILGEKVGSDPGAVSLKGVEFRHPGNVGDAWKDMKCAECHGEGARS